MSIACMRTSADTPSRAVRTRFVTVRSTSDEALDALAEAMAQGGKAVAADPTMVQWAHDAEQADRMVTRLATDHEGTVVLLKGSHASGLSALAERWTQN